MLKSGCPIYIMQFFCFISNCLNIGAAHKCDFSNDVSVVGLLWSEIIVCDMASSFEAIGKRNKFLFFIWGWKLFLKNIENILILVILITQSNLDFSKLDFSLLLFIQFSFLP